MASVQRSSTDIVREDSGQVHSNAADRGEKGRADSRNSRNEAEKSVHDAVVRRDSDDKPFMNLSKMSAGQLDGTAVA